MFEIKFYLPHEICVTTFPISSNTFLGLISWFVELCPSCPYPPAPNVNTPPSCKISNTSCSDIPKDNSIGQGQNIYSVGTYMLSQSCQRLQSSHLSKGNSQLNNTTSRHGVYFNLQVLKLGSPTTETYLLEISLLIHQPRRF